MLLNTNPLFSVSLLFTFCLCIPVSHSCIHCLTVFLSHFWYPWLMLCSMTPNIILLFMYVFDMFESQLWILFSLFTQPHRHYELLNSDFHTSRTLALFLPYSDSNKATLSQINFQTLYPELHLKYSDTIVEGQHSAWAEANVRNPSELPIFQLSSAVH